MNIVICDDEPYWTRDAAAHIHAWAARRHVHVSCTALAETGELLAHLAQPSKTDLVLLDIAFADAAFEGMRFAKRIRQMGIDVPLLFLTSNGKMAQEGYIVEAMGFLTKPIDDRRLTFYLDRLHKKSLSKRFLQVDCQEGVVRILYDDLCYAEVIDHIVQLHTPQGRYDTRLTLAELLKLAGGEDLVRIHRSFAVSKSKILSIRTAFPRTLDVAVGSERRTLPIGRGYGDHVLQAYALNALDRLL